MSAAPDTTTGNADRPSSAVEQQICSHGGCACVVDRGSGVEEHGHVYCCEGCAAWRGCAHEDCACAEPVAPGADAR